MKQPDNQIVYESITEMLPPTERTPLVGQEMNHSSRRKHFPSAYNWRAVIAVLLLVVFVLLLLLCAPKRVISGLYPVDTLSSNGLKVNFRAHQDNPIGPGRYVKVDLPRDSLILGETFPKYQSSTFEVFLREEDSCYKLKSMNGKWVTIQKDNSLVADESRYFYATSFESHYVDAKNKKVLKLKVCDKLQFVEVAIPVDVITLGGTQNPLLRVHSSTLLKSNVSEAGLGVDEASARGTTLEVHALEQYRGVNLGGWFIPEVWMLGSFFAGTGQGWGSSLCAMMNYSVSVTEARMQAHLKTWITEQDFQEIRAIGFNSVRLPVGYWNLIPDPYGRYAPRNLTLSLQYIDWAFDAASRHGLSVLLDLHGMPGSQNGQDHSGCSYSIVGQPQWTEPRNVDLSLRAVEAMAARYGSRPNLMGFELMNEPSQRMSQTNHSIMRRYYEDAYRIIRRHSQSAFVVFNELYEDCYDVWDDVLREPEYYNVMADFHLYDWQGPYNDETRNQVGIMFE